MYGLGPLLSEITMAIILTNKPFSPVATEWYPSLPVTAQVYDPIFMLKISFPSNDIGET